MTENEALRILGDITLCSPLGQAAFVGIEAIKKLKLYREIGTVEECREAREKQRAKKPLSTTRCKDGNHPLSQDIGRCPSCKSIISENMLWCDDCGQKLDWSDTE